MSELHAYLAGAVDADGFITIQRSVRTHGKNYSHAPAYHSVKIGLSETEPAIPHLLYETFGGSVYEHQPKNPTHKRWFCWQQGNCGARRALLALQPYLRLKKRQAELALEFITVLESHWSEMRATQTVPFHITTKMLTEREAIYERLTALNSPRNRCSNRLGKSAGRLLDGKIWDQRPEGWHGATR